ncbi:MAG: lipopolysaccharide biosynthesis protein [Candidatus Scalindua rubra]|uniref:non-specific protein-tyrosine kinase n=1 Tax=Candidatus Scalindua rubra TaxID=1872076 RepID=A0A1E3X7E6_9BACT|nr:MAG: lipopolysaccharide biosynthesis protein [Candidatus Scalindua rubra]
MSKIEKALEKFKKEIKKDNESGAKHRPLIDEDYDQLMEDGGLISKIKDTSIKGQKTESVIPTTKIDNYDVDERIVSYYDSIGKQTWKGPVMVHFRRLQVYLNNMQRSNMCKVMLFTSSNQKEGKSTIALNTAIMLCSDKKSKIAIVDCDFRKPTVHKLLGFSPDKGLSDYLVEEAEIKDIFINGLIPNLTVIPVGNKPPNTCELFASDRMKQFMSCLREQFDCVVIDTPPVLAFPDTVIISPLSDGVIFVINCKNTRKTVVKRAVDTLHDCKIMGFVMNMSEAAAVDYYGYTSGYYYYDYAAS